MYLSKKILKYCTPQSGKLYLMQHWVFPNDQYKKNAKIKQNLMLFKDSGIIEWTSSTCPTLNYFTFLIGWRDSEDYIIRMHETAHTKQSCRKVSRVNNCGPAGVWVEPEGKFHRIITLPQSIHSKVSPHPASKKREQKSINSKRLHNKTIKYIIDPIQYLLDCMDILRCFTRWKVCGDENIQKEHLLRCKHKNSSAFTVWPALAKTKLHLYNYFSRSCSQGYFWKFHA